MELRQLLSLIAVLSLFASCHHGANRQKAKVVHEDTLVNLSQLEKHPDDWVQFFIMGNEGKVYITEGLRLHNLYKDLQVHDKSFDEFVDSLYDGALNFDSICAADSHNLYYAYDFEFSPVVYGYYTKHGISSLLRKYCKKDGQTLFFKKVPSDVKKTVAYCAWLNGYHYNFSCVSGVETLEKIEGLTGKQKSRKSRWQVLD